MLGYMTPLVRSGGTEDHERGFNKLNLQFTGSNLRSKDTARPYQPHESDNIYISKAMDSHMTPEPNQQNRKIRLVSNGTDFNGQKNADIVQGMEKRTTSRLENGSHLSSKLGKQTLFLVGQPNQRPVKEGTDSQKLITSIKYTICAAERVCQQALAVNPTAQLVTRMFYAERDYLLRQLSRIDLTNLPKTDENHETRDLRGQVYQMNKEIMKLSAQLAHNRSRKAIQLPVDNNELEVKDEHLSRLIGFLQKVVSQSNLVPYIELLSHELSCRKQSGNLSAESQRRKMAESIHHQLNKIERTVIKEQYEAKKEATNNAVKLNSIMGAIMKTMSSKVRSNLSTDQIIEKFKTHEERNRRKSNSYSERTDAQLGVLRAQLTTINEELNKIAGYEAGTVVSSMQILKQLEDQFKKNNEQLAAQNTFLKDQLQKFNKAILIWKDELLISNQLNKAVPKSLDSSIKAIYEINIATPKGRKHQIFLQLEEAIKATIHEIEGQLSMIETENKTLQKTLSKSISLEEYDSNLQEQQQEYSHTITVLKQQLELARQELTSSQQRSDMSSKTMRALQQQIEALQLEHSELQAKYNELVEENALFKHELKVKSANPNSDRKFELQQEIVTKTIRLQSLQNSVNQTAAQFKLYRENAEKTLATMTNRMSTLDTELSSSVTQLNSMTQQHGEAMRKKLDQANDLQQIIEQKSLMLWQKDSEINRLKGQVMGLNDQVTRLSRQIEQIRFKETHLQSASQKQQTNLNENTNSNSQMNSTEVNNQTKPPTTIDNVIEAPSIPAGNDQWWKDPTIHRDDYPDDYIEYKCRDEEEERERLQQNLNHKNSSLPPTQHQQASNSAETILKVTEDEMLIGAEDSSPPNSYPLESLQAPLNSIDAEGGQVIVLLSPPPPGPLNPVNKYNIYEEEEKEILRLTNFVKERDLIIQKKEDEVKVLLDEQSRLHHDIGLLITEVNVRSATIDQMVSNAAQFEKNTVQFRLKAIEMEAKASAMETKASEMETRAILSENKAIQMESRVVELENVIVSAQQTAHNHLLGLANNEDPYLLMGSNYEANIQQLQVLVHERDSHIVMLNSEVEIYKQELMRSKEELNSVKMQCFNSNTVNTNFSTQIESLNLSLEGLRFQLHSRESEILELKHELQSKSIDHNVVIQKLNTQLLKLNSVTVEHEGDRKLKIEQLKQLERFVTHLEGLVLEREIKIGILDGQLSEKGRKLSMVMKSQSYSVDDYQLHESHQINSYEGSGTNYISQSHDMNGELVYAANHTVHTYGANSHQFDSLSALKPLKQSIILNDEDSQFATCSTNFNGALIVSSPAGFNNNHAEKSYNNVRRCESYQDNNQNYEKYQYKIGSQSNDCLVSICYNADQHELFTVNYIESYIQSLFCYTIDSYLEDQYQRDIATKEDSNHFASITYASSTLTGGQKSGLSKGFESITTVATTFHHNETLTFSRGLSNLEQTVAEEYINDISEQISSKGIAEFQFHQSNTKSFQNEQSEFVTNYVQQNSNENVISNILKSNSVYDNKSQTPSTNDIDASNQDIIKTNVQYFLRNIYLSVGKRIESQQNEGSNNMIRQNVGLFLNSTYQYVCQKIQSEINTQLNENNQNISTYHDKLMDESQLDGSSLVVNYIDEEVKRSLNTLYQHITSNMNLQFSDEVPSKDRLITNEVNNWLGQLTSYVLKMFEPIQSNNNRQTPTHSPFKTAQVSMQMSQDTSVAKKMADYGLSPSSPHQNQGGHRVKALKVSKYRPVMVNTPASFPDSALKINDFEEVGKYHEDSIQSMSSMKSPSHLPLQSGSYLHSQLSDFHSINSLTIDESVITEIKKGMLEMNEIIDQDVKEAFMTVHGVNEPSRQFLADQQDGDTK